MGALVTITRVLTPGRLSAKVDAGSQNSESSQSVNWFYIYCNTSDLTKMNLTIETIEARLRLLRAVQKLTLGGKNPKQIRRRLFFLSVNFLFHWVMFLFLFVRFLTCFTRSFFLFVCEIFQMFHGVLFFCLFVTFFRCFTGLCFC